MKQPTIKPSSRHIHVLGIGLELACSGGSCGGISLRRDKCHLHLKSLPYISLSCKLQFQFNTENTVTVVKRREVENPWKCNGNACGIMILTILLLFIMKKIVKISPAKGLKLCVRFLPSSCMFKGFTVIQERVSLKRSLQDKEIILNRQSREFKVGNFADLLQTPTLC